MLFISIFTLYMAHESFCLVQAYRNMKRQHKKNRELIELLDQGITWQEILSIDKVDKVYVPPSLICKDYRKEYLKSIEE
ncbi:hypothetical protein [Virgibacillus ndiopensis]|uniref:hypothetical protein n=1 Tax=Virgibacillus ndiopensis TaxID=2004408 RepID=UPI000C088127|nr:hypothetical protein [Virgibacillus ndiopensis]